MTAIAPPPPTSIKSMKILIVDDHDATLRGTLGAFTEKYPDSTLLWAQTTEAARKQLKDHHNFDLVVLDLSLPVAQGQAANANHGIELMKTILHSKQAPNILVMSANIKPVVRLKSFINGYTGGVAMLDKGQSLQDMLHLAEFALRGSICWPQQVKGWLNKEAFRKELDSSWLEVLQWWVNEGLNDKGLAQRLNVSERTIRNYWLRLQDNLCLTQKPNQDVRMQIYIAAKELGLLD